MNSQIISAITASILLYSTTCFPAQPEPFSIPDTETRHISSSSNGKDYELYVKLPSSYDESPDTEYPLIVLNDASYAFPIVTSMVRRMAGADIQDAIVVGVSYSKGDDAGVSRTRDYTPTNSPDEPNGHSAESRRHSGHSYEYMTFLAEEILPFIAGNYRIDSSREIFVGHSFGGLLGAYILVKRPEIFDYYILGSPSFWYDDRVIFDLEERYSQKRKEMPAHVYMAIGELEDNNRSRMVSEMAQFKERLLSRHYGGLELVTEVLEGETHLSVFPALASNGLRWAIPESKE